MPAKQTPINLLGQQDMDHSAVGRIISWAITYGRYIMIGTEIVVLLAFISRFSLDRKLTDLKEEIAQKQMIIEANLELEADVRSVQDKLAKAKTLLTASANPTQTLTDLQSLLPLDVKLETLSISGKRITATATAGSTNGFSQFLSNIKASSTIQNVDIGEIQRNPVTGMRFSFNADAIVKKGQ